VKIKQSKIQTKMLLNLLDSPMENFVKEHYQCDLIRPIFTSLAATWQHSKNWADIECNENSPQNCLKLIAQLLYPEWQISLKPLCRLTLRGILASNLKTEQSKMYTKMLPKLLDSLLWIFSPKSTLIGPVRQLR
jgi:hypothetical protein